MALMVLDRAVAEEMKAQRRAWGGDRFDEVWEGIYMMAPLADNEHQDLQGDLCFALRAALGQGPHVRVQPGANVSDREEGWTHNYRCPDVVVVFPGGRALDCGTHWCGGPDFCVEIVSDDDRSRDKFAFYARIGVRELLLIDRDPWQLELYRLEGDTLRLVGRSLIGGADVLRSAVLPGSLRLVPGPVRARIEITHQDGVQRWMV